jgi:hypothetical protein
MAYRFVTHERVFDGNFTFGLCKTVEPVIIGYASSIGFAVINIGTQQFFAIGSIAYKPYDSVLLSPDICCAEQNQEDGY